MRCDCIRTVPGLFLCSDLDPCHAPQWSVRARMSENPQCLLGQCLNAITNIIIEGVHGKKP